MSHCDTDYPLLATTTALISRLNVLEDAPTEEAMLEALDTMAAMKAAVAEVERQVKAAVLEHVKEHGEIQCGDVVYVASKKKKTKQTASNNEILAELLARTGGDEDEALACMSAGSFKPGACAAIFGDTFRNYFSTEYEDVLEFKKINKKFVKQQGGQ